MEEIRDLIKIINDHTRKNLPLIDLKVQEASSNKELNLYLGLKTGEYRTDSEASHGIYGSEDVDFKFRMLKSRLNRKLLNHLFFADFTTTKREKPNNLYQECLDYLHYSRMLLKIGETGISSKLLNRTIELAKAREFTCVALACLKELRVVYADTYRPKLFNALKEEISALTKLADIEEEAEAMYYQIDLFLNSNVNNRKKSHKPILNTLKKLEKLAKDTRSYNILEKYIKLQVRYFELIGDYKSVLKFTANIQSQFDNGKINADRFDPQMIDMARFRALFKNGDYQLAFTFARKHEKEYEADWTYWQPFMETYLLTAIHQENYDLATNLLLQVINSKHFKNCDEMASRKSTIFKAYLYFLTGNKNLVKKFDFNQFMSKRRTIKKSWLLLTLP